MNVQELPTNVTPDKRFLGLTVDYKENGIESQTLVDKAGGAMKLLAFDQGTGLKEHTAPHDVYLFILEGEAEVTVEGQPVHLQAGDMIALPANRPHAVLAQSRFKMLLTLFRG